MKTEFKSVNIYPIKSCPENVTYILEAARGWVEREEEWDGGWGQRHVRPRPSERRCTAGPVQADDELLAIETFTKIDLRNKSLQIWSFAIFFTS